MTKKRRAIWALIGLATVVILAAAMIVQSLLVVPDFYGRAVALPAPEQQEESRRFIQNVAELSNSLRREGAWRIELSKHEVNGWLAFDLPKKHPDLLPAEFQEPRIDLQPGAVTVACLRDTSPRPVVISFKLSVELPSENLLHVRVEHARAGRLPLPLKGILDSVTDLARQSEIYLRWQSDSGAPTAAVDLSELADEEKFLFRLQGIELTEDKIVITGQTDRVNEDWNERNLDAQSGSGGGDAAVSPIPSAE